MVQFLKIEYFKGGVAAIAQWFRLCLPSCHPVVPGWNPKNTINAFLIHWKILYCIVIAL